ncbi:hypothetical protein [Rhodohalobacter mucosus]|uniref:Uncharacterized protein n=1 Tax=Rhodohalobacter mucosus TaxID=2079485 RepID=A0A316TQC3_9BACT|nr:hypothetical protein [Rhodohalobacter mucosus]PWN05871.1 hypothetical protein DDZ15_11830 [Rhodohalobacter mucosus]
MPLLDRSDLKYDYIWSTEPAKKPRSSATTENVSRPEVLRSDEGDKVLTFLNGYAESRDISDKEEARNLEPLLQDKLKEEGEMTEPDAEKWLDKQRAQ